MKHLNFLSKRQTCSHNVVTLASTVGSPSAHRRGAMLRLLSVLVLVLTLGVGQMWGADTQQTYTLSTAHNNSSQTTGAVTWQIGANAIGAGNGSNPLQKLQGTITVVLPANAQLNSVTINKGSGWGSNARVQFKVGNTVLNTFSTNGTYTLKSTDNKTNLTYSFQYSGSGNAWVSSIAVSYEIVAATPATVILHDADGSTNVANKKVGDSYTLPNTAATCTGKVFLGWSTSEIATTNTKPTYYKKAESVTLVATNNFYAVYASENGSTIDEVDYTYTFSNVATAITATDASTFSLSWTKGNSNTVYNGGVRLYGGGKLQISSSKTIKAIEFTKGTSNWDNTFTANVGSYNDTNKKWEGSATSITFTESGTSGHKNIASIKITYETTVTAYNKYTTSCCTELGSINGSVSLTQLAEGVNAGKLQASWDEQEDKTGWASNGLIVKIYEDGKATPVFTTANPISKDATLYPATTFDPDYCTTYYATLTPVKADNTYCDPVESTEHTSVTTKGQYTYHVTLSGMQLKSGENEETDNCSDFSAIYEVTGTSQLNLTEVAVTNVASGGYTWNTSTGALTIDKTKVNGNVEITITGHAPSVPTVVATSVSFDAVDQDAAVPAATTFTIDGEHLTGNLSMTAAQESDPFTWAIADGDGSLEKDANDEVHATVTVTPKSGITDEAGTKQASITISGGGASNVVVPISLTVQPRYTVSFSTGTGNDPIEPIKEETYDAGITLPSGLTPTCDDWTFVGWATAEVGSKTSTAPAQLLSGSYKPAEDIMLYAVYSKDESGATEEAIASVTISTYASAHSWGSSSSAGQKEIAINSDITATLSAGGNTGKYYDNGWRTYQSENATLTLSAANSCTLKSATFTYTVDNTGTLLDESTTVSSGSAYAISGNSYVFSVGNTGSATNGQVRFTAISVTYDKPSTTTYYWSAPECCTDKVTITKGEDPENGTFTIDKNGDQSTCEAAVTVIVTPTPGEHCRVNKVTASNSTSVSGPDGEGNYTVTYAQNSNAASTINVSFVTKTQYKVTWNVNGDESTKTDVYDGEQPVFPSTPESCDDAGGSEAFYGWATAAWTGKATDLEDDKLNGITIYTKASELPLINGAAVTYYAVFAKATGGGSTPNEQIMNENSPVDPNSNWQDDQDRNNGIQSYAGKSSFQMYGETTNSNPCELTSKIKFNNITGISMNVAANNANTVYLYYSADGENWTTWENTVSVSTNTSSYTDYAFDLTEFPTGSYYICLSNSKSSLYMYSVTITSESEPEYSEFMTTCCTKHNVTISGGLVNGSVTSSLASACEGTSVTLTATGTPNAGRFKTWSITGLDSYSATTNPLTFNMPASNITVSATFDALYAITKSETGGTITLGADYAAAGDNVTISASANQDYENPVLKVFKTGEESTEITISAGSFTMPAYAVTAKVTCTPSKTPLPAPTMGANSNLTYNSVQLNWTNVANNSGYVLTVKQGEDVVEGYDAKAIDQNATSTVISGLEHSTAYTYSLYAKGDGETYVAVNTAANGGFTTLDYPEVTLYYSENGTLSEGVSKKILTDFELADPENDPCEKKFVGWSTATVEETDVAPEMMLPGDKYQIPTNANCTIYAVYANVTPGSDIYTLTPATSVGAGTYIIAGYASGYKALTGGVSTGSNNDLQNEETGFSIDVDGNIEDLPASACEFTLTAVTGGFTIQKPNEDYLGYTSTTSNRKLAFGDYSSLVWNATALEKDGYPGNGVYLATSEYKIFTNGSGSTVCRGYQISSNNYNPMYLFKKSKGADIINGGYATTCAAAPEVIVDPEEIEATSDAVAAGVIEVAYSHVDEEHIGVALYNDAECSDAFDGGWLTASINGDKNIAYTLTANTSYNDARSAYIKLTAPAETSGPAAAEVIIPVTQAKKSAVFASLQDLVAADVNANTPVTVSFSNVIIKEMYEYNDNVCGVVFNIQKDGKDIKIYFNSQTTIDGWVAGGKLSGTLTDCPWKIYSEAWQLAPASGWAWANLEYTEPASVSSVTISGTTPDKTTYSVGEAFDPAGLTVTVTYSNSDVETITSEDEAWNYVSWSKDPAIFAAEHIGTEKSVSVTATFNAITSTSAAVIGGLTVNKVAVSGISMSQDAATLKAGKTVTLTATIAPTNATYKDVNWSTSDGSVATVENGVVTAVAEGTATITATAVDDENKTATCSITVLAGINFAAGDWTLVTDAAELTEGSYVIIAAAGYNKAMKSYGSGNNCKAEDATKNGNMLEYDEDFGIFEIDNYEISAITYKTFQDVNTDQYLFLAANDNQLKAQDDKDENAAWTITSVSGEGVAIVTSKSQSSRTMRYNDGSDLFACYSSGQKDIALYKYYAPVPKLTYDKNTTDEVENLPEIQKSVWEEDAYKATVAAGPSRYGYTFTGWNSAAEGNGVAYAAGTKYSFEADITLYAQWEAKQAHHVTYVTVGTAPTDADVYYEGDHVTLASASGLSNPGYVFNGWSDGTQVYSAGSEGYEMPDNDVIFTATWAEISSEKWVLVTHDDALEIDGEYAIVSTFEDKDHVMQHFALGEIVTMINNKAGQAEAVTRSGNIVHGSTSMVTFTLKEGNASGKYAFKNGSNYLTWTSGNTLDYANAVSANSSWTITIGETNDIATIANVNDNSRKLLYNSSNPRFACYTSAQKDVQLFRKAKNTVVENTTETKTSVDVAGGDIIVGDNGNLTINVSADKQAEDLTVKNGGKLTLTGENTLKVNNVYLSSTMASGKSSQMIGTLAQLDVQGEVNFDITLGKNGTNQQWHAFTVPFEVDVMSGIYDKEDNKLTNEVNYAIMEYHGDERAKGNYGWKKIRTTLVPGTFYIMATDGYRTTYRFKKKAGAALVAENSKQLYKFEESGNGVHGTDNGWNGVGNPNLFYGKVDLAVQVLDPESYTYVTKTANSTNFVVGTPFFYQAAAAGTMEMATADADANYAPARVQANEIKDIPVSFGNEIFTDYLYVSANEDALNTYETGKDLVKMTMTNTPSVAQIFGKAYDSKLSMVYTPIVNNQAEVALELYAPQAGEYTIGAPSMDNADLYLTYEGSIIWNLSMGEYEIELAKGTTNGYGLLLQAKAPQVTTGVDQLDNGDWTLESVQKVIIDEHVFILRGGQMYDVTGKMVK